MCSKFAAISMLSAVVLSAFSKILGAAPAYTIEQAVAVAQERNPEILIARKKVLAARGSFIEARSGFLPSLTSSGLYDKRQTQSETNLRQEDYNAILKQEQLSAGIVSKLNVERAEVALANERPELFNTQTELKNSYLRLAELFGTDLRPGAQAPPFEISGELQYRPNHADLNGCLARADV